MVVLETTTNVWDMYDIIAPRVSRTVVAHAGAVRQIAEARVKTDKKDIKRLIRLLIADIVPEVWVPPVEVRELRGMISYRNRLVKTQHDDSQPPAKPAPPPQPNSAEGEVAGQGMVGGAADERAGEDPDSAGTGHAG